MSAHAFFHEGDGCWYVPISGELLREAQPVEPCRVELRDGQLWITQLAKPQPDPSAITDSLVTDLVGCARCHGDGHERLTFRKLTRPVEAEPGIRAYTFTHWATCPATGEPILMSFFSKGDQS